MGTNNLNHHNWSLGSYFEVVISVSDKQLNIKNDSLLKSELTKENL